MKKLLIFGIIMMIIFCIIFINNANAGDTGSLSPSATGSYRNEFTNPTNAYTQNDVYARATKGTTTDEQDYYSFSINTSCFGLITDIRIYLDAYSGSTATEYYTVSLSWNGGTSWSSTQNTNAIGQTDTDTYVNVGGTWGRTWSTSELTNANFRVLLLFYSSSGLSVSGYLDHIYIVVTYDEIEINDVSEFKSYNSAGCDNSAYFNWLKGSNSDYTRIQRETDTYPTTISDGTNVYNGTNNYCSDYYLNPNKFYYYSAWAYNSSCNTWSEGYDVVYFLSPCSYNISLNENIINATGEHEYVYDSEDGFTVWANFTGNETPPTLDPPTHVIITRGYDCDSFVISWDKDDLATKTLVLYNDTIFPINHNPPYDFLYSGSTYYGVFVYNGTGESVTLYSQPYDTGYYFSFWSWNDTTDTFSENFGTSLYVTSCNINISYDYNLKNVSNGIESFYSSDTGWLLYVNYTGNTTPITLYENLVNCSGVHEYILTALGYNVYANFTGSGGGCMGIVWVNKSDENMTMNISVNCTTGANTTSYTINETNWFSLLFGTVMFDTSQFGIIIQIILFFIFVFMSFKVEPMEGKQVKGHLIPFIGGIYLLFAGLNFIGMVYGLSAYVSVYISGFLTAFGITICILGILKAFYYKS